MKWLNHLVLQKSIHLLGKSSLLNLTGRTTGINNLGKLTVNQAWSFGFPGL